MSGCHGLIIWFQVYASKYPGFQIAFTVYGKGIMLFILATDIWLS